MEHKNSKYDRDDRIHIVQQIENLKNDEDYNAIFEILMGDPEISYTPNSNGLFLNFTSANDKTLDKISKYLRKVNKKQQNEIEVDVDVIPNTHNTKSDRTYKLSNYEKNILKQRNLKKVLNEDHEYEEMKLVSKKMNNRQRKQEL